VGRGDPRAGKLELAGLLIARGDVTTPSEVPRRDLAGTSKKKEPAINLEKGRKRSAESAGKSLGNGPQSDKTTFMGTAGGKELKRG